MKEKTYKNIGIITHCSGITTTFSLIDSIANNFDNRTGVSLLWLGDVEDDFILINELAAYTEQQKLNMNLMLTKFEKGWLGPYGKVMPDHISDFMPPPSPDTMILMSALEGELAEIKDQVLAAGYSNYIYV